MLRIVSAFSGVLAVLAAAVVLFVWFADRGRGPEAVVVALPDVATEAIAFNDAPEPTQEHTSAPPRAIVNDGGDERPVHGGMERSHAPVEESSDELDALTTAAGEIDGAESVPSHRASSSSVGDVENLYASSQGTDASPDQQPDRSSGVVEPSVEKAFPPPRTVPRHGQLAWFEIGVLTRSSNLRENPDVNSAIVARLSPGTRVRVLEERPVFGYYRVSSDGKDGWVWWLNVDPDH